MRSKIIAAVALALSTLFAAPAFADGNKAPEHAAFPMAAATFKQKVDQRTAKARQRMEARASKLPAEKAKELRARFEARVAKVNAEVTKVTADGTVTKEEAKEVRKVAREGRGPRGRGHRGAKG